MERKLANKLIGAVKVSFAEIIRLDWLWDQAIIP
jgi:hypothetical protein